MQELEEFLSAELKKANNTDKKEYIKEILKIIRFSSASKYYHHV